MTFLFLFTGLVASLLAWLLSGKPWARPLIAALGLVAASALFLWLAWWRPVHAPEYLLHGGLLAAAALIAGLLWWRGAPGFSAGFFASFAALLAVSLFLFPALTHPGKLALVLRPEIEALAGGKPYCARTIRDSSGYNPSFLALDKRHIELAAVYPKLGVVAWLDDSLTVYVRTGEPVLRLGYNHQFTQPSGLSDVITHYWSSSYRDFVDPFLLKFESSADRFAAHGPVRSVDPRIIDCIPRADYLANPPSPDSFEISATYGDFVIPRHYRPDITALEPEFQVRIPLAELGLAKAQGQDAAVTLMWGHKEAGGPMKPHRGNGIWLRTKADFIAEGFVENEDGLYHRKDLQSIHDERADDRGTFFGFDADGVLTTSIGCQQYSGADTCRQVIRGPDLNPDHSETLWLVYPREFLADWRKFEENAPGILAGFLVPGSAGPGRADPACIEANEDGACLIYDAP